MNILTKTPFDIFNFFISAGACQLPSNSTITTFQEVVICTEIL